MIGSAGNQRIESIPDASLSMTPRCGGHEPDPASGIAAYAAQMLTAAVAGIANTAGIEPTSDRIPDRRGAARAAAPRGRRAAGQPDLPPGQLSLGRRRKQLAGPSQTVLILPPTSATAAPKGTARMPLRGLQDRWRAENLIVIGYPANRALQRL